MGHVPSTLPGGSTNMVEGLYRGWDELRSVPAGSQSGLRVIVLFTDGASNSIPSIYDTPGVGKAMRTYDFPQVAGDTNGQTWMTPHITGFYDTGTGARWELRHPVAMGLAYRSGGTSCVGARYCRRRASTRTIAARGSRQPFRCRPTC